jgi:DNA-binding transcriptional regulator YhcF (GntR family)
MRFWVSREASAPIREQLAAQLILGILSRKYPPGERLPSVRELARRLSVHANTVSAVYKDLAARGWVSRRAGAGVYVNDRSANSSLEAFARECVTAGLERGFTLGEMHAAFASVCVAEESREFVVVDSDAELARVIAAEVEEATGKPVAWARISDAVPAGRVLASEAHADELKDRGFRPIRFKATEQVIAGWKRPDTPILIAVVSRSPKILAWSSTLLSALGFPPECVVQRVPGKPGWRDGLRSCQIIGADVVAVRELPSDLPVSVFRVLQEEFIAELQSTVTVQEV